jgi:hypothetical protein
MMGTYFEVIRKVPLSRLIIDSIARSRLRLDAQERRGWIIISVSFWRRA